MSHGNLPRGEKCHTRASRCRRSLRRQSGLVYQIHRANDPPSTHGSSVYVPEIGGTDSENLDPLHFWMQFHEQNAICGLVLTFFCVFPPLLFLFVQQHSCLINEYDNDDNDDDDDDDAVSVMWRVRGGWVSSSASAAILAKQVVYCFSGACPFVCVAFCLSAQKNWK